MCQGEPSAVAPTGAPTGAPTVATSAVPSAASIQEQDCFFPKPPLGARAVVVLGGHT